MKKLLVLLLLLGIGSVIFYACQQSEPVTPAASRLGDPIPAILQNFRVDGLAIPNGTRTVIDLNGSRIRLLYPEGIVYVPDGDYSVVPTTKRLAPGGGEGGSYTCTGQCTDGCNVFYVSGSFACSECKNGASCTGKASFTSQGGFADLSQGVQFIVNRQQARSLLTTNLQAPSNFLSYKFVREALQQMNQRVHGTDDPSQAILAHPENYRHVAVNAFGFLLDYAVPLTFLKQAVADKNNTLAAADSKLTYEDLFYTATANQRAVSGRLAPGGGDGSDSSSFSCSCTSGSSSGCTAESGIGYKMCRSGDCTSCKMTVN